MNNDRELLELAAKAAGIELEECTCKRELRIKGAFRTTHWNPLTDDDDRYRLVRKLGMALDFSGGYVGEVRYWIGNEASPRSIKFYLDDPNDEAYAIVRAAAEIGSAMP